MTSSVKNKHKTMEKAIEDLEIKEGDSISNEIQWWCMIKPEKCNTNLSKILDTKSYCFYYLACFHIPFIPYVAPLWHSSGVIDCDFVIMSRWHLYTLFYIFSRHLCVKYYCHIYVCEVWVCMMCWDIYWNLLLYYLSVGVGCGRWG